MVRLLVYKTRCERIVELLSEQVFYPSKRLYPCRWHIHLIPFYAELQRLGVFRQDFF